MGKTKTLTVRSASWTAHAAEMLERAMLCDPGSTVETLRELVESGAGAMFRVEHDARVVGYVVLRIDRKELFPEGVIVAAAGHLAGSDLVSSILPEIEKRFVGVSRVRVHTARPGLLRKLARHGYEFQEIVIGKKIPRRQPCQQQQGGGGGSSSSAESTTQNIDKRLVVDQGIGISSDSSTVNVSALDGGSVAGGLDLARSSLALTGGVAGSALDFGKATTASAMDFGRSTLDFGRSSLAGALDLSTLSVDRVLSLAGDVFKGGFGTIDKNAALLDKTAGFVDKAYADAKGSGAERFYIAVAAVAVVAVVAVKAGKFAK